METSSDISEKLEKIENSLLKIESLLERLSDSSKVGEFVKVAHENDANGFDKLASDTQLSVEQLRSICDIQDEDIRLLIDIPGRNETEKQSIASIIILTFYHYLLGKSEISAQALTKKLQWLGIKSLPNLSRTLRENKQFIIPNGKPGSQNFNYRLTYPGIKQGLEHMKEICKTVNERI